LSLIWIYTILHENNLNSLAGDFVMQSSQLTTERASSRTYYLGIAAGALMIFNGLILFFAPDWASQNFAWNIAPFTAMTMGAWCMGGAAFAIEAVRQRRWGVEYPGFAYLGAFGLLEIGVLVAHLNLFKPGALLTTPYLLMLLTVTAAGISALIDWRHRGLTAALPGDTLIPVWMRVLQAGFVLSVGILALILLAGPARPGKAIFPDEMSAFTAHAFGAFYLSLVLTTVSSILAKRLAPVLTTIRAGFALALIILVPAFMYFSSFDFAARPGGLIYIGANVLVILLSLAVFAYAYLRPRESMHTAAGD
jgi:hypothetical protein